MSKRGLFLVFEGIDGAGKSRQMDYTAEWLVAKGRAVTVTREPGGTAIGAKIRSLLLDPNNKNLDPQTELFLYAADRAQHIQEIIMPDLNRGNIVLCDRFTLSTVAYQGYGRGLDKTMIQELNRLATQGLEPDLTLVLDLEPQQARERIACHRSTAPDRLEQEKDKFFHQVRQGYLAAAQSDTKVRLIRGGEEPQACLLYTSPQRQLTSAL